MRLIGEPRGRLDLDHGNQPVVIAKPPLARIVQQAPCGCEVGPGLLVARIHLGCLGGGCCSGVPLARPQQVTRVCVQELRHRAAPVAVQLRVQRTGLVRAAQHFQRIGLQQDKRRLVCLGAQDSQLSQSLFGQARREQDLYERRAQSVVARLALDCGAQVVEWVVVRDRRRSVFPEQIRQRAQSRDKIGMLPRHPSCKLQRLVQPPVIQQSPDQ